VWSEGALEASMYLLMTPDRGRGGYTHGRGSYRRRGDGIGGGHQYGHQYGRGVGNQYGQQYGRGGGQQYGQQYKQQHNTSSNAHMAATTPTKTSPSQGQLKEEEQKEALFGNFAHYVHANEGNIGRVSIATQNFDSVWILDYGASKHVTGSINEFDSYSQYPLTHRGTIQTADGTSQTIRGVGSVQYTQYKNSISTACSYFSSKFGVSKCPN
jgi:hypothetical protein